MTRPKDEFNPPARADENQRSSSMGEHDGPTFRPGGGGPLMHASPEVVTQRDRQDECIELDFYYYGHDYEPVAMQQRVVPDRGLFLHPENLTAYRRPGAHGDHDVNSDDQQSDK